MSDWSLAAFPASSRFSARVTVILSLWRFSPSSSRCGYLVSGGCSLLVEQIFSSSTQVYSTVSPAARLSFAYITVSASPVELLSQIVSSPLLRLIVVLTPAAVELQSTNAEELVHPSVTCSTPV